LNGEQEEESGGIVFLSIIKTIGFFSKADVKIFNKEGGKVEEK